MGKIIIQFILFISLVSVSPLLGETANPLLTHTAKLESDKWTLYFTAMAEKDLLDYEKVHSTFKNQMEIISFALVNQKDEIVKVVTPPPSQIFAIKLEKEKFLKINTDNKALLAFWDSSIYGVEEKESYVIRFIQNAVRNPLGQLTLKLIEGNHYLEARVLEDSILFPLSFIQRSPKTLFDATSLNSFFQSSDWEDWEDPLFLTKLKERLERESPPQIRKGWFLFSTETSSQYTDDFIRWLSLVRTREVNMAYAFILHSHPYPQQWRKTLSLKHRLPKWAETFDFVMLPSAIDIKGNLEGIIPFAGIYSWDPKTSEGRWAYYPIDEELFKQSIEINQSLAPLWKRDLNKKEELSGQEAVKAMLLKRARYTPLLSQEELNALLRNSAQFEKAKLLREKKQLQILSRGVNISLPEWSDSIRSVIEPKSNAQALMLAANTWELFMSQHPIPEDMVPLMFYLSNQIRIRTYQLQLEDLRNGKPNSLQDQDLQLTIDEPLFFALQEAFGSRNNFSSQKELFQQLQETLLAYLQLSP